MFVLVLILSGYMLWSNLKGYKSIFLPNQYLVDQMNSSLEETKKTNPETYKGILITICLMMAIISITFYSIAANTFITDKILMVYSVLQIIIVLIGVRKFANYLMNGVTPKRALLSRLLVPVNTVFISYFIYTYVISLQ